MRGHPKNNISHITICAVASSMGGGGGGDEAEVSLRNWTSIFTTFTC